MKNDQYYMNLALELAASAKGHTNPNPLVGAVLVKGGVIVGTGLHRKAGEPHAEVHAFNMAGEHAQGATLYVTLEPCSHYGKTPPCAKQVVESGVARVVVATVDPNPSVAGRGIRMIQEAGIEVEVGVQENEAKFLNKRFMHNMIKGLPYVRSKFAMTLDGKIATYSGHSQWISGEESRADVHELRNEVDGILVGVGTVIKDNPALTTRLQNGQKGKNPTRIIMDRQLRTPVDAQITNREIARTIIVTAKGNEQLIAKYEGVDFLFVDVVHGQLDLQQTLEMLYKEGITDLLVEGGGTINASFLRANLIDEYIVYIAPKVLGGKDSIAAFTGENVDTIDEAVELTFGEVEKFGHDLRVLAYPKKD